MASHYERELRAVLIGSPDGVRAVTRSCTAAEKARAMQVIRRPFLVVRAAGSGVAGAGDLLAVRGDISFPIEVKTTKEKKVYLSGRTMVQYLDLQKEGERCGLMPLYAMRLKGVRGDSWRIFKVETSNLTGAVSILARRLPALPLTRNGTPHLDWDEGLPLHNFLSLLCRDSDSYTQTAETLRSKANAWTEKAETLKMEDAQKAILEQREPEEWVKKFRL
ncbi:MAG: Holliday junction resolvase [Methanobacteriota archaeon]|nr:MAG: Holliday junction resolvase [Euryarchaeota archaeon]HIG19990.1 Holliday junction resolvase [Candidatus Poseidoniales archaeon]